jgi:exodeoxyribonuclease VII small subunit
MSEKVTAELVLAADFSNEKLKELRFEDGIKVVEDLVARVETGALSLDKALQAYERGALLIDHLRSLLEGAEAKLQVLNEKKKPSK